MSLFHVVCFVTPNEINEAEKFTGAFWSGYGFMMVAFVGHLVYSCIVFSERNYEKSVMNTPLTVISFVELGVMIIVSIICMKVPGVPIWVGILLCYMVLILSVVTLLCVNVVGEKTAKANIILNQKTYRFREFIDKAQEMTSLAKTPEKKVIAEKIYEAIRYSDLVSAEETQEEERLIQALLEELSMEISATKENEAEMIDEKATQLLRLIEIRNNKCKAMKRQCD